MSTEVTEFVIKLAIKFTGRQDVTSACKVFENLAIRGSDAVEFFDIIESKFTVDLRPVTESVIVSKSSWTKKYVNRTIPIDVSLQEIICFVVSNLGKN